VKITGLAYDNSFEIKMTPPDAILFYAAQWNVVLAILGGAIVGIAGLVAWLFAHGPAGRG
jgi:hypothetical protein